MSLGVCEVTALRTENVTDSFTKPILEIIYSITLFHYGAANRWWWTNHCSAHYFNHLSSPCWAPIKSTFNSEKGFNIRPYKLAKRAFLILDTFQPISIFGLI